MTLSATAANLPSRLVPAMVAACAVSLSAAASADEGVEGAHWKLISGAPIGDPNVAVHTVEEKAQAEAGRFEFVLYPVSAQVNGGFTQHFGTMGAFIWHLQERFGLFVTGGGNWYAAESSFNEELATRAGVVAQSAASLLWTWGVAGGVEVAPVYGKFALFDSTLVHFELIVNGAAGAGGTAHMIKPVTRRSDGTMSPASYGDTGVKFLGSLGLGVRVRIGAHWALRLELRDVVYTARVSSVNGCGVDDLSAIDSAAATGQDPANATVSAGCQLSRFSGRTAAGDARSNEARLALDLLKGPGGVPSSDVLNNVGLSLGVSVTF